MFLKNANKRSPATPAEPVTDANIIKINIISYPSGQNLIIPEKGCPARCPKNWDKWRILPGFPARCPIFGDKWRGLGIPLVFFAGGFVDGELGAKGI